MTDLASSKAEPGSEKGTEFPWLPGSAREPASSGLRPKTVGTCYSLGVIHGRHRNQELPYISFILFLSGVPSPVRGNSVTNSTKWGFLYRATRVAT